MSLIVLPLSVTNVFLLPCPSGYLQIDCGYEYDYYAYLRGLSKAGIDLRNIRYLFLTHHHDDHAGFLNQLVSVTEITILAHENARTLLRAGMNDRTHGGGYANRLVKFLAGIKMRLDPRWSLAFPSFELRPQDVLLTGDDDQVLRRLGIAGKAVYTPGHSIDHTAVVLDSGEAFCGDAASSFLLWTGTHYTTIFMSDMDEAYRSWQKMLDAGARMVYPSHGRPFPADKLRQNIGRIKTEQLARFF